MYLTLLWRQVLPADRPVTHLDTGYGEVFWVPCCQ
jgi:hypothetical protein